MKKLNTDFYNRENVLDIARELLGKIIITNFEGKYTSARIVETEAYAGLTDKASHSFNGKRTNRNEHMYGEAGISYVYICYGIHHLFNVVTNKKGLPDAVLIRAAEPLEGIETMLERAKKKIPDNTLTRGPGNLSRAMGITTIHNGMSLAGKKIFLATDDFSLNAGAIGVSKRIGIDGAGADALLPYRFYIKGNRFVSGRPVK